MSSSINHIDEAIAILRGRGYLVGEAVLTPTIDVPSGELSTPVDGKLMTNKEVFALAAKKDAN